MHTAFQSSADASGTPITFATKSTWGTVSAALPATARQFALANGFAAKPGQYLALPSDTGALAHVLFGIEDESIEWSDPFRPGQLPGLLPAGFYRFANTPHNIHTSLRAWKLSLQPLPQGRLAGRETRTARWRGH
jgi:leucyl aminopeptidase